MEILFNLPPPGEAIEPRSGDVCIRPGGADRQGCRSLALFVLERGPSALIMGEGEPERILVQSDPTLDDLLAATFAELLLGGGVPPEGAKPFARYVSLAREGLHPGNVPLEESLEGVFLAIRNKGREDLAEPGPGARFLADWRRMAAVIMRAAAEGVDPFSVPLFKGEEFAREKAFLLKDREVYQQDVLRGQRWIVKIEGGPESASGLYLKMPKSVLFKNWSRSDPGAPAGGTYLFLAVQIAPGRWVFSTDPVQRLPIEHLFEKLQQAEDEKAPGRAWFDGAPFDHTLVASPPAGTLLDEEEVLKIVSRWARARHAPGTNGKIRRIVLSAAAATALILVIAASLKILFFPAKLDVAKDQESYLSKPGQTPEINFLQRGPAVPREEVDTLKAQPSGNGSFAIVVGVGGSSFGALPAACGDAAAIYGLLRDRFGFPKENMRLLVDEPGKAIDSFGAKLPVYGRPDMLHLTQALEELAAQTNQRREGDVTNFVFFFAGHGDKIAKEEKKTAKTIGYLVLSDYWERQNIPAYFRGFDMGYLSKFISSRIGASHQLLLVDCCFAGLTAIPRGRLADTGTIYKLWKKRAHVVVTAATDRQLAYEEENGHSLFTREILEGLGGESDGFLPADKNADGVVTDEELGAYLQEKVPKLVPQGLERQTPVHYRGLEGDDVGQFLFIPKETTQPAQK